MTENEVKLTKPWKPAGRKLVIAGGCAAAVAGLGLCWYFLHWLRIACENGGTYYYCDSARTSPPWAIATGIAAAPVLFWSWLVRAWNRHVEVAVNKRAMELAAEKIDATAELLHVVKDWMALASSQEAVGGAPLEPERVLESAPDRPPPQPGTAALGFKFRVFLPKNDDLMKRSEEAVKRTEHLSQQLQDLNTQFYSFNPNVYGRW